jgi:hypothetical protein
MAVGFEVSLGFGAVVSVNFGREVSEGTGAAFDGCMPANIVALEFGVGVVSAQARDNTKAK